MNDNELAQRAVACKGWRWMEGMRAIRPSLVLYGQGPQASLYRITRVSEDGDLLVYIEHADVGTIWADEAGMLLPDFNDPATRGCLPALVREAWSAPWLYFAYDGNMMWEPRELTLPSSVNPLELWRPSEVESMIATLELAPCREVE